MTKLAHNRLSTFHKVEFWSVNSPDLSLSDLSTYCLTPKLINARGIERFVPCSSCLGCVNRVKKSKISNMTMESFSFTSDRVVMATLTYDSDHLPIVVPYSDTLSKNLRRDFLSDPDLYISSRSLNSTNYLPSFVNLRGVLVRRHFDLFVNRLRKFFKSHYGLSNIRYYVTGEYGSESSRPHFHVIFYGIPNSFAWLQPKLIELWRFGNVRLDSISTGSFSYVSGYTLKKSKFTDFVSLGLPPQFQSGSSGLGFSYIDNSLVPLFVSKRWLPTNFGSLEDRFLINYFSEHFGHLFSVPTVALYKVDKLGRPIVVIPSAKSLSLLGSRRPVPYGTIPDTMKFLYFDHVRQERIFNRVIDAHGLRSVLDACRLQLVTDKSLGRFCDRWIDTQRLSIIDLETKVSSDPSLVPDRFSHHLKLQKLQRSMDKVD